MNKIHQTLDQFQDEFLNKLMDLGTSLHN